jgi:hypothetical protein
VARLSDQVLAYELRTGSRCNKRSKTSKEFARAVGALLSDLLVAQLSLEAKGWIVRPMRTGSFSGEAVSYRNFVAVLKGFKGLG